MKAITLWQPWASLIAVGAKTVETRSWATGYSGPLAIHAAKSTPYWVCDIISASPFEGILEAACGPLQRDLCGRIKPNQFPKGVIVATCELVDCIPASEWCPSAQEAVLGDFSLDRFAWILADIKPLSEPIPAKGAQGLWEWQQ